MQQRFTGMINYHRMIGIAKVDTGAKTNVSVFRLNKKLSSTLAVITPF